METYIKQTTAIQPEIKIIHEETTETMVAVSILIPPDAI